MQKREKGIFSRSYRCGPGLVPPPTVVSSGGVNHATLLDDVSGGSETRRSPKETRINDCVPRCSDRPPLVPPQLVSLNGKDAKATMKAELMRKINREDRAEL